MADPVASRVLSGVEFDVVWESLGLGPTPVVLNLPSPGRTHTERRHIVAGALSDLRCRGLAGPAGSGEGVDDGVARQVDAVPVRVGQRAHPEGQPGLPRGLGGDHRPGRRGEHQPRDEQVQPVRPAGAVRSRPGPPRLG